MSDPQDASEPAAENLTPLRDDVVVHVLQQAEWDCGAACLLMAWIWLANSCPSREAVDQERMNILEILATRSIWTMDLAYALHKLSERGTTAPFEFLFCSSMFEANMEWKDYSYYSTAFEKDQQRTRQRFECLRKERPSCLHQHQRELQSIAWVMERIQNGSGVAILLIDNAILASCMGLEPTSRDYAGHYLLVTGFCEKHPIDHRDEHEKPPYDDNRDIFLTVYNPNAARVGMDCILARHIELAWQAQGTDQDVIFVRKLDDSDG